MTYLGDKTMTGQGDCVSLVTTVKSSEHEDFELMACSWVDRNRRYFISSAGTTNAGSLQERDRWRQSNDIGPYQQHLAVSIPSVAETYYSAAGQIDRHNRVRQADIDMERTLKVMDWSFRINTSILAMTFVDAWLFYKHGMGARAKCEPNEFFTVLAQLVDEVNNLQRLAADVHNLHSLIVGEGCLGHLSSVILHLHHLGLELGDEYLTLSDELRVLRDLLLQQGDVEVEFVKSTCRNGPGVAHMLGTVVGEIRRDDGVDPHDLEKCEVGVQA